MKKILKLGIVGICGRGARFKDAVDDIEDASIHAICDIKEEGLPEAARITGVKAVYTDYSRMLEESGIDAVIIGTPMQFHASQAIAALERGISVLSEVTAGISVEECRSLVEAARRSSGIYMMAENYVYRRSNIIIKEIIKKGLFGVPYYAEGEYIHDLKHMNEYVTPWRRIWQTGIEGVTYGTHSLGPVLQWMPGRRVVRVCCEAAGTRHYDNLGRPYCQACSTMLCKTDNGGLIKIRVDMVSNRPHNMINYHLQGTDGCYESGRAPGEKDRIWLRERCKDENTWTDLEDLADEFMPPEMREKVARAQAHGHGGGDYLEIMDFVDALRGRIPNPIDVDSAMDMTLPGLISQRSILEGGRWIEVPDSRRWE